MVPIENDNNESCSFRVQDKCLNDKVGVGVIVNDSLQSRWFCSACSHFANNLNSS